MLVLGGTVFLSKAIATEALGRGHSVFCAARGQSGDAPAGAAVASVDRDHPEGLASLAGFDFDSVVDVGRLPSHVHRAIMSLGPRAKHWIFVSTVSVYSDDSTPGQRSETAPLHDPLPPDGDEGDPKNYGFAKVACERLVTDAVGDRALIVRAGLIVGPGDPSDRFTYWVHRVVRAGDVLAPGSPDDAVQFIDVRDLAAWIVAAAESQVIGVVDAINRPVSRKHMLEQIAAGVAVQPDVTWVGQEFLQEHDVRPWSGPRSLPLWLPLPQYAGFMTRDVRTVHQYGLRSRPLDQTACDTFLWLRHTRWDEPLRAGLSPSDEAQLLDAWFHR